MWATLTVPLLLAGAGADAEESAPPCSQVLKNTSDPPPKGTAAAYRTACRLKEAGLEGDALRAVVAKVAETDPAAPAPADLLVEERPVAKPLADRVVERASAAGRIVGAAVGLALGSWGLLLFLARGVFGRARVLRNLVGSHPLVVVEPLELAEHKQLPTLFQSVLDNLGNDVGGQNIQFVSPQGAEATEVSLADAPSEVKYLSWVLGLVRPLAPKDRITVRLAPQPEGRQGLGISVTLIGPRGSTISAITLWEAELGLGGIATASPPLSEKERYQLLAGPLATWVYFALADLQQKDVHLFGARRWRSYGLFYVGSRLYKTHRDLAQQLLRAAVDDDPGNIAAHLNVLYAEFDYRRTSKGKDYFEKLRAEVEALPPSSLAPRRSRAEPAWYGPGPMPKVEPFWYDAIWYRTMYGLAAVCLHIAFESLDRGQVAEPTEECGTLLAEGEELARLLVGACWVALTDLEGTDGSRPRPLRSRTDGFRAQFRQKLELAALLNQMLPSAVLLLGNFVHLVHPQARELEMGADGRVIAPEAARRWRERDAVLSVLSPLGPRRPTPELEDLLRCIDPVDFLPARARYNAACLHSQVAQFQDRGSDSARCSRHKAIAELQKVLGPDSAQWAREDPALLEVRRHPETRSAFAQLLARKLPERAHWQILQDLTFLEVGDAARLWLVHIRDVGQLLAEAADPDFLREITAVSGSPPRGAWITPEALESWVRRAELRRHLGPLIRDAAAVDRVETMLHRLGIASVDQLATHEPWSLSRKLESLAPSGWGLEHLIGPWSVAAWCQAAGTPAAVEHTDDTRSAVGSDA